MWRQIRISILLVILAIVAWNTWYDRISTTDWDETLYVGVFPINAEGSPISARYIERLTQERINDIERFVNREAARYGVDIPRPMRVQLYPELAEHPPARDAGGSLMHNIWWSLKLRTYARRASRASGLPPPQIRIFVLFHDPSFTQEAPHSVGLQKGLVGVVHGFADHDTTPANNVVIAHEILHTLGATDKYNPASLAPVFPIGYAEPERVPRYPQPLTEIMAGRRAVSPVTSEMPESLDETVVGPATALELRWKKL